MIEDPSGWLREDTAEALAWQADQTERARGAARSAKTYDWVYDLNLRHQTSDADLHSPPRLVGERWFRFEHDRLVVAASADGPGRLLLDASDQGDPADGRAARLWFFEPSLDGRYCAVAMALGGDIDGVWVVVDAETGAQLPVRAPALLFNSSRPGWLPGSEGFLLATRTEEGRHLLNRVDLDGGVTPLREFGFDEVLATVPAVVPQVSRNGTWVAALSAPHELVVRQIGLRATGEWRTFLPEDFVGECFGDWQDDATYVAIITDGAPFGRVVAIPAATSADRATWTELVAESQAVLRGITVLPDKVVVLELQDVSLGIRVVTAHGTQDVALAAHSSTMKTLLRVPHRTDALVIDHQTFLQPPSLALVDHSGLVPLGPAEPALEGIAVSQNFALAADGTRLPHYVVQRADLTSDGLLPTLVYAYGGYNAPVTPTFLAHYLPFVLAGGRFVVVNIRGGGEYGQEWHEAARLATKQTTYDDLFAIVDHLIAQGLATPSLLALQGFSNGGATCGVAITQRPDLWRVVSPGAPMLDFLEWVKGGSAAEAMKSYFTSEFGDPADPEQLPRLHAMSPYHNVKDGIAYPAVFSVFGELDPGCPPFSGRLLTERLRKATVSGHPVHLRVWPDTGHGNTGDAGAQWDAEWMAFVLDQLGMPIPT